MTPAKINPKKKKKAAKPAAKTPVDTQLAGAIAKGRAPMYKQISDQLAGGY